MSQPTLPEDLTEQIKSELAKLDSQTVDLDGVTLLPSQCYYVELNPFHVLFNTNCPADVKTKVTDIISRATGEQKQ